MAKTLPSVPVHDGSKFNWTGKAGVADASDFGNPSTLAGRLYGDACDVGFYVGSGRSGRKVLFSERRVERRDNEVVAYHYGTDDPSAVGVTIIVFND